MAKHTDDTDVTEAEESTRSRRRASSRRPELPRHSFFNRLYTGTGAFEVIGRRKLWFTISGLIVAIAIASIVMRGFTFGIDFEGGTKVSMPAAGATGPSASSRSKTCSARRWARMPNRW